MEGGGGSLDFSKSPTDPLGEGIGPWTLQKSESSYKGGVQSDARMIRTRRESKLLPLK